MTIAKLLTIIYKVLTKKKPEPLTHATSNLGLWLNGKIGLYFEDLANPKDNADLAPNCL